MQTGIDFGLANLGEAFKLDEEAVAKIQSDLFHKEVEERIAADQEDPSQQDYIQRLDTKDLIKTDAEYASCVKNNIPLRRVGYRHALHILAESEARHRTKIKKRHARKVARSSRRRNR